MLGLEGRINKFLNYMKNFSVADLKVKSEAELKDGDLIIMVGKKKDDASLTPEQKADDKTVADHYTFEPLKNSSGSYHVAENESEAIKVGKEVTGDANGMFKLTSWEQIKKDKPECPIAKETEDKPKAESKDPEELPDGTKKDH